MSIYSDLKKVILLLDEVDRLKSAETKLTSEVQTLRERVARLERGEEAVVLSAEKAARNAAKEVVSDSSSNLRQITK
ncbi:MAG: hypothetical protein KKC72_07510 [Alphaproteobacteria bacterium]|nr:hypothetical protein [Alphaproteobacteria bacterium]MBU1837106.1 hypothetical protein [Alphaproteobacteria bacterium]